MSQRVPPPPPPTSTILTTAHRAMSMLPYYICSILNGRGMSRLQRFRGELAAWRSKNIYNGWTNSCGFAIGPSTHAESQERRCTRVIRLIHLHRIFDNYRRMSAVITIHSYHTYYIAIVLITYLNFF